MRKNCFISSVFFLIFLNFVYKYIIINCYYFFSIWLSFNVINLNFYFKMYLDSQIFVTSLFSLLCTASTKCRSEKNVVSFYNEYCYHVYFCSFFWCVLFWLYLLKLSFETVKRLNTTSLKSMNEMWKSIRSHKKSL